MRVEWAPQAQLLHQATVGQHGLLTWKPLSVDSGAGLGWGAGWAQHGGEGAPLFDSGDHVDRREGEDAGGVGSGREGHGGGSSQRGARGHDSGAGQGGAGAAGKAVGDTTGRQHQSEQPVRALAGAVGPVWAADPGTRLRPPWGL